MGGIGDPVYQGKPLQGSGNDSDVILEEYKASAFSPFFGTKKARGTRGTPVIVDNGDEIGKIQFYGYDGVAFQRGAEIIAKVDAAPGANDMPAHLSFQTAADGATLPTEHLRIASDGGIFAYNLGAAAAATDLGIDGSEEIIPDTSSERYKENIRDVPADDLYKWLAVIPRLFEYKSDGSEGFGAIAEEFVAAGLNELVFYKNGVPESIRFSRLAVPLTRLLLFAIWDKLTPEAQGDILQREKNIRVHQYLRDHPGKTTADAIKWVGNLKIEFPKWFKKNTEV